MKFMEIIPQKARGPFHAGLWTDPDYWMEIKYDGERRIGQFMGKIVRFTGTPSKKTGKPVEKTEQVPHLSGRGPFTGMADGIAKTRYHPPSLEGTILDGEFICPLDPIAGDYGGGKSKYVTSIANSSPEEAVRKQIERGWLRWAVFDCLFYKGQDLRDLPLYARREAAGKAITEWGNPYAFLAECYTGSKLPPDEEGLIFKHRLHRYGDAKLWIKKKHQSTADVVIMGFRSAKEMSKKVNGEVSMTKFAKLGLIGAVQVGQYEVAMDENGRISKVNLKPGSLNRVGLVEVATISGMTDALRAEFSKHGKKYLGRVARIKHNGREPTGRFRHPRWDDFRADKAPRECVIDLNEV